MGEMFHHLSQWLMIKWLIATVKEHPPDTLGCPSPARMTIISSSQSQRRQGLAYPTSLDRNTVTLTNILGFHWCNISESLKYLNGQTRKKDRKMLLTMRPQMNQARNGPALCPVSVTVNPSPFMRLLYNSIRRSWADSMGLSPRIKGPFGLDEEPYHCHATASLPNPIPKPLPQHAVSVCLRRHLRTILLCWRSKKTLPIR